MRRRHFRWIREGSDRSNDVLVAGISAIAGSETDTMRRAKGRPATRDAISCEVQLEDQFPPLARHDEVVVLLHAAAEIEHSLLVQYLYAAYSLETDLERLKRTGPTVPADADNLVRMWRDSILTIAVQEMGHFLTVQNLLLFIGGPLNFEREDLPFKSDLYPFHFALRPLSRSSLAQYIAAEMPLHPTAEMLPDDVARDIREKLRPDEECVNRVGALYDRLGQQFAILEARVFRPESIEFQARAVDWGADSELLVQEIGSREDAIKAIAEIGRQGEGWTGPDDRDTHFSRFLKIYRHPAFPDNDKEPTWNPTRPVPINPRTVTGDSSGLSARNQTDGQEEGGREEEHTTPITDEKALWWAHVFNLRYRMLLYAIDHSLRIGSATVFSDDENQPLRQVLISWSRRHMTSGLREVAMKLVQLPADESRKLAAAPPFELPDSLAVPDRDTDRWLRHLDMIEGSRRLIEHGQTKRFASDSDPILHRLRKLDDEIEEFIVDNHLDGWATVGPGRPENGTS